MPGEAPIRRHAAPTVPRLAIRIILHFAELGPARVEGEAGAAQMVANEVRQHAALPRRNARAAREVVRRRHARAEVLLKERAEVDRRLTVGSDLLHAVPIAVVDEPGHRQSGGVGHRRQAILGIPTLGIVHQLTARRHFRAPRHAAVAVVLKVPRFIADAEGSGVGYRVRLDGWRARRAILGAGAIQVVMQIVFVGEIPDRVVIVTLAVLPIPRRIGGGAR